MGSPSKDELDLSERDDCRLSTTVGGLILDELETEARNFGEKGNLFKFGRRASLRVRPAIAGNSGQSESHQGPLREA